MTELAKFVKAYDVRGTVPDQINADVARAFGAAFVRVLSKEGPVRQIVIGHDMRPSSPDLAEAFGQGATSEGADVVLAGLGSTDMLYFAAGYLDVPGAMFTASHNPAKYNGIKLCRAGAKPPRRSMSASTGWPRSTSATSRRSGGASSCSAAATPRWIAAAQRGAWAATTSR